MNKNEFKPYSYLMAFGTSVIVTFFTVPALSCRCVPDLPPWLLIITAAAIGTVSAFRLAWSGVDKSKFFGIVAAIVSLCWLVFLVIEIKNI
jgi:hypothetical protein